MKTDLEKFVELYKSFGIDLKVEEFPCEAGYVITLTEGENRFFGGYARFFSEVFFDSNGKFESQAFWE